MNSEEFYTFNEYMKKKPNISASEEDYLEMIYRLCIKNGYTRVNDIANALNVKAPSVSSMMKRLVAKDFVYHKEYGTIELTSEGRVIGKILYERHKVIEQFLKLIDTQEYLLEEVEKIEHTLSPQTVYSLKILVTFFHNNQDILKKYHKYRESN